MTQTRKTPKKPRNNQIILPFLKGKLGSVAISLLIIGLLFRWQLPSLIGTILAIRWGYLYQKEHPQVQPIWRIACGVFIGFLIVVAITIAVSDIMSFR